MLARCFGFGERGATLGGEIRGGLTTFMYCFIKLVRGRGGGVRPIMYGTALAFVVYFVAPWFAGLP